MHLRAGMSLLLLAAVPGAAPAAEEADQAATAPAKPAPTPGNWGPVKVGLQLGAQPAQPPAAGGKLRVRLWLRNVGLAAVKLPPPEDVFAWAVVAYSREEAYVTQRVRPAAGRAGWPDALEAGKTFPFDAADLSGCGVYPYAMARQVYQAYLDPKAGPPLPQPDAVLSAKLSAGAAKLRLMLCLPCPGRPLVVLVAGTLDLDVAPPQFAALAPAARAAYLAELLKRFDRDAFSAQAAHHEAVRAGEAIVADLAAAAKQTRRPGHSRLWLATALADIRCQASAAALSDLLQDGLAGVRCVVAYHGPKQHSDALDRAIVDRALKLQDSGMTAYAVLGFLVFRRRVPAELSRAGLDSPDPRVRATVARAIEGMASDFNLARLVELLKDNDQRVRGAAAAALGQMKRGADRVVPALIDALDSSDEAARQRICSALAKLTGLQYAYDPSADGTAKDKTLAAWKEFLAKQK